ncbi:hypothetical protein SCOCK_150179 [Actinacidiphila cocklensis]|uniref:Uncharacterized protein n=1 Tax=Actinacidiphila cocklensis TaxID=887465 RepID=A0A9W4E3R1_9ACTN|nr:hypothetical protein SCOCK_150179 [Actinacidiphila cocklensis]
MVLRCTDEVLGRDRVARHRQARRQDPHVTEMHGVKFALKYAPGMKPPFVVNTSYPA